MSMKPIEESSEFSGVEKPEICRSCGGKCCKYFPGGATPEDFGAPNGGLLLDSLRHALSSGRWTVDWNGGGDDKLYFVRPAIKGAEGSLFDHAYAGECTFLGSRGCELGFNERPESCRMLIPNENSRCDEQRYTRKYIAERWRSYQKQLLMAATDVESVQF